MTRKKTKELSLEEVARKWARRRFIYEYRDDLAITGYIAGYRAAIREVKRANAV